MARRHEYERAKGQPPALRSDDDGARADVARRLTALIALPDVAVSPEVATMPRGKPVYASGRWERAPVEEAKLERASALIPSAEIRRALKDWWLAVQRPSTQTPNWDIAAACTIRGRRGLMLAEAKAHADELSDAGKSFGAKFERPQPRAHRARDRRG